MLPAFITGLVYTLFIYVIIAIAYLATFFVSRKLNIMTDLKKFAKYIVSIHAIYFLPITFIKMFNVLNKPIISIILAVISVLTLYPIANLILRTKNN